MTMETRNKVFKENLADWLKAKGNRKKRAEIGAHMVFSTKCHPKSVSRTFKRIQLEEPKGKEKRGRKKYYDHTLLPAIRDVWKVSDYACGEVLHPMIGKYVEALRKFGNWAHALLSR